MKKVRICLVAVGLCLAGHLTSATAQLTQVFPPSQTWKYSSDCHDGDNWQTTGYDDSAWGSGPGGFTGAENNAAILPIIGTTSLPDPRTLSPAGHAMYFRTHFTMATAANISLVMSNAIDDGATIYLNGTQILNLRVTTPGTCASFSGGAPGTGTEALLWEVHTFTPADLAGIMVAGDNVLAVEVHQNSATSSDMVFAMALMSQVGTPPVPPHIAYTNGTGVITFDTAPPAQQWSTRSHGGANSDIVDAAGLDTAAKTNDAAIINVALASVTGNPPTDSAAAVWTSSGYLQTRPTGVAYSSIMATLTNASGGAVNSVRLTYSLTVSTVVAEQINGHLVYYSLTGTPGSWVQIPELSNQPNDNTAGTYAKSGDMSFGTPWAANSLLYVLWVDDNAAPGSPDTALEIDNVQFSNLTPTPPTFVNNTDPTNRSVLQCRSTTLSASASGVPNPTYQWFKNDLAHPIGGATTPSYTIASMQSADAGSYFLQAVNANGTAYSHTSVVTYVAVPFSVVRVLGLTNLNQFLISFSLPIDTSDPAFWDGTPSFQFDVTDRAGSHDSLQPDTDAVINGTNVLITTVTPRVPGHNYDFTIAEPVRDTCTLSELSGTFQVLGGVFLLDIDDVQQWRYNDTGVDPGPTWMTAGYNDSGWLQGKALFDGKKVSPQRTDITNIPVRTELVLTNIAAFNLTNDLPTYNFRTHIGVTALPQYLEAVTVWDDGGALFINGTVQLRSRDDATNVFANYNNSGAPTGEGWFEGPFSIPPGGLAVGDNTVAVELKQANATSSDATMGLQLIGYYAVAPPVAPKITYTYVGDNLQLSFTSGTLYQSIRLGGPPSDWTPVGSGSPVTVHPAAAGGKKFYRLQ